MMRVRVASTIIFSVDWETFVYSGEDVRTCYENLSDGEVFILIFFVFYVL